MSECRCVHCTPGGELCPRCHPESHDIDPEITRLRAEVTAAKADALDQAADDCEKHEWQHGKPGYGIQGDAFIGWLRRRAADTRAELGDS